MISFAFNNVHCFSLTCIKPPSAIAKGRGFRPIFSMKESVIYQEILAKGITEGEILGFKKGEANLILKQINRRVGNISTDWVNKIQELSLEQLEDLGEALLDFTSQSDLINWFNYLEENKKNIR